MNKIMKKKFSLCTICAILVKKEIGKGRVKQRKTLAAQGFSDMENRGLEPLTSTLPALRSPS
jgi:hypothetical protein